MAFFYFYFYFLNLVTIIFISIPVTAAKLIPERLTESVIYSQQDQNGISVYGGGEGTPRFKISKTLFCSS